MLSMAGIPVLACERTEEHPLVIAGGSCALNPEPMADFIDFFVIGDAEELIPEFLNSIRDWKRNNDRASRKDLLKQLATIAAFTSPACTPWNMKTMEYLKASPPSSPKPHKL
jgi:radical SAM superfamily enzyme YgiQ (UPF0313 family)